MSHNGIKNSDDIAFQAHRQFLWAYIFSAIKLWGIFYDSCKWVSLDTLEKNMANSGGLDYDLNQKMVYVQFQPSKFGLCLFPISIFWLCLTPNSSYFKFLICQLTKFIMPISKGLIPNSILCLIPKVLLQCHVFRPFMPNSKGLPTPIPLRSSQQP